MNARELTLRLLTETNEEQVLSHIALKALDGFEGDPRDRALISKLVHGTLERQATCDMIIEAKTGKPVTKLKPKIRNILRMSIYQLLFLTQIPAPAICNEAVKLAKKSGYAGLAGFVNGVLRGLSRDTEAAGGREAYFTAFADGLSGEKRLCFVYSFPEKLLNYFLANYPEEAEEMFRAFLSERGTAIRLNKSRGDADTLKELLKADGIEARDGLLANTFRLSRSGNPAVCKAFRRGLFSIQDESSALSGNVIPFKAGMHVLDLCAAPGGKTVHAADELAALGGGTVLSRDLTAEKIAAIKEQADRVGLSNVICEKRDATVTDEALFNRFDVVIADLPCSGFGVIGRKPDIKWKTGTEQIAELAALQRQILQNAVRYVKPGGILCFSTCTITKEENDDNADYLESLGMIPVDVSGEIPDALIKRYHDGRLQLFPQDGTDGFFLAVMRKKDETDGQN